jgi:hypothetical protein
VSKSHGADRQWSMQRFHLTSVMLKSRTFDSIEEAPIRLECASSARGAVLRFRIRFCRWRCTPRKNVAMQERRRYYTAQFRYADRRSGALQNASDRFLPE